MKKWNLLAFLFVIAAGTGFAQNLNFKVCAEHWKSHHAVSGLTFTVMYQLPGLPTTFVFYSPTDNANCINFSVDPNAYPAGTKIGFSASKIDSSMNGISIADNTAMYAHILGILPFQTPAQVFSGDVNNSGSLTTFDVVLISKALLQGVSNQDFNWGAIPEYVVNSNPWNPDPNSLGYLVDLTALDQYNNDTLILNAYKKGDVDGDYDFDNYYNGPTTTQTTKLMISDQTLTAGQVSTAYIALESAPPITSMQFALNFDSTKIKILSAEGYLNSQNLYFGFGFPNSGEMRVTGTTNYEYFSSGYTINHPIIKMEIKALDNVVLDEAFQFSNSLTPFILSKIPNSTYWRLDSTELVASATIGTKEALNTLKAGQAMPNPFDQECSIQINLQTSEEVLCEVSDLTGKIIWSSRQYFGAGEQRVIIPAAALPSGAMGFYRISTPSGTASGKIQRK